MQSVIQQIDQRYKKKAVVDVKSGDTIRVSQKVIEGGKTRVQVFEGLVIRTDRKNSLTSSVTVRRIASGVGVEKTYLLHSPNVTKIVVTKRSKVRRNYLSYMRELTGKSARLTGKDFDRKEVNEVPEDEKPVTVLDEKNLEPQEGEPVAGKVEATESAKEESKADQENSTNQDTTEAPTAETK